MCWNDQIYNIEPETYTRIIIVVQIKLNFLAACEKGRQREAIQLSTWKNEYFIDK